MLISAGFGMLPAAMWTRNSGPTASADDRSAPTAARDEPVEPLRVAQFLHQQRVKIVRRELPEEIVQALLQGRPGKAGFFRPGFQRQPAEEIVRLQPGFRHVAQHPDQAVRRTRAPGIARGCASTSGTPPRSSPATASLPAADRRENSWAGSWDSRWSIYDYAFQLSSANSRAVRPVARGQSIQNARRGGFPDLPSEWPATEKTFARSNTRIKPVSPSATSRPVSGEMICTRAHGGK